jgi:ankyrin repeat protein
MSKCRISLLQTCLLALFLCVTAQASFADPVHDAARKGNMAKLQELAKANPSAVSTVDKMGRTPLHMAAEGYQLTAATFLLEHGADVNAKDRNGGFTALDLALSSYHYIEMVRLLIDHGANVNTASTQGVTPLMEAAMRNQKDAIALLLEKGADPNARDEKGNTALLWALMMGRLDSATVLINSGADVNLPNGQGVTPMKVAKMRQDSKLLKLLQGKGARD